MRHRKVFFGTLGLIMLSLVMSGCFGLFGPKVGNISGTVMWDDDTPVVDATVKVADKTTKTDKDGKFKITGVQQGEQNMTISAKIDDETVEVTQKVTIGKDELVVSPILQKPEVEDPVDPVDEGVISGVVEYESGDAVVGATVRVKDAEALATTDGDGKYTLPALEYGDYTIVVTLDGEEVGNEDVTLSADSMTVDFTIPDPVPEWRLVYEENFSGTSNDITDYGWAAQTGWEIVEADGKRWIQGDLGTTSHTWIEIPELAEANKVRLKYTNVGTRTGSGWATGILGDSTTDVLGGKNYFVFRRWNGLGVRMQGMGGTDLEIGGAPAQDAVITIELTYDREVGTIEVVRDGVENYAFDLEPGWIISGEDHVIFHLYLNNATARWTDLEVWVQ